MSNFTILGTAERYLNGVVDAGTKDYAIVISSNPSPVFPCYGIRNKTTFVDEILTTNLPKARFIMRELQKDYDQGYDRAAQAEATEAADFSMLGAFPIKNRQTN